MHLRLEGYGSKLLDFLYLQWTGTGLPKDHIITTWIYHLDTDGKKLGKLVQIVSGWGSR